MFAYMMRRLVFAVPTLLGITLLAYLMMDLAPGDPVRLRTFRPNVPQSERARLYAVYGLNDPIFIQYVRWLAGDDWMRRDSDGDGDADSAVLIPLDADGDGEPEAAGTSRGILRGDFGVSFATRRPVVDVIGERILPTLELGSFSLIIGTTVGIAIGIGAAINKGGWFDTTSRVMAVVFDAVPIFWLALMLIIVFGAQLDLLPMQGRCRASLDDTCPPLHERLEYLVLPTFVLSTGLVAGYSRFMRASMLDMIQQDYIRTAQAKGLPARLVWFKHAARNSLVPIATFIGPSITGILGGAVVTETIFSFPGLGKTAVDAVIQRDYPMVMAVTLYAGFATVLGYLLSDILYGLIDPRVRYQ